ncbi:hypothetical protein P8C59_007296 [Phyllachora maydis]|uniref:Uncharacterized protein n=1 Tax=Phyllachora maydis TaxID=1825666 RepID=A0AAD9I828_9PEZI|nr:hypothetical protein P8C59_007296 [Phyllachora maydis]
MTLSQERPGYYDTKDLGVPISDLNSIGTVLTYRSVPAWDAANVRRVRALLHRVTLAQTAGQEATHEFRYVPSLELPATALGVMDDGGKKGFLVCQFRRRAEKPAGPRDRDRGAVGTGLLRGGWRNKAAPRLVTGVVLATAIVFLKAVGFA